MISVESSDVLGLGFVIGEEMEEGEASYYQNHDEDDDLTVDPDVALSYIDEKLQDVLGHFQKDFEGGVSAENLGAKFGGYGSFLPTYQRSPALSHQRTPPKVHTYSSPRSPNNLHLEGGLHDSVNESSASISARIGAVSLGVASLPALKTPSVNDSVKRNVCMSSTHAKESTSKCALIKSSNHSDQKIFKVRIKVGSDNLSTRKKAEIYSGLGLDISPSSSVNDSPMDSGYGLDLYPDESPTSILQIMTSCPAHGSLMLTPLPNDSICLIQKEKLHGLSRSGSVCKSGDQENSEIFMNGSDSARAGPEMLGEKKTKPSNKYSFSSVDLNNANGCDTRNGIGVLLKKETDLATESCEELVSNALRLPLLSNSYFNVVNSAEDTVREIDSSSLAIKGGVNNKSFSALAKEEPLESVSTEEHRLVEKPNEEFVSDGRVWENKKENYDDDESVYSRKGEKHDVSVKGDSNVSKGRKPLKTELVDTQLQKTGQKATSHEEDGIKLAPGREQSSSGGKKKSKIDYSSVPKSKTSTHVDSYVSKIEVVDFKKDHGKARDTYIALFGDLELEQDSKEKSSEEIPYQERLKNPAVVEKSKLKSNSEPKERSNVRKIEKPSSSAAYPRAGTDLAHASGNGPIANASGTVAPLVNEDWVCCDKCQKWRLLPFGTNPDSLPEKWLCSMLYWLPGMNRCNIGEEETTKAVVALSQVPAPAPAPALAPTSHSSQHGHFSGILSGLSSADGHIDQNRLDPGLNDMPSVGKKKCGLKDVSNAANHDVPTQFSNSMKNPQAPIKSRSFNGVNQSPTVNEVDFHSTGPYSSLVAEKHRHKRKEKDKKKLRESYSGRGDSQSSKKRNKKESNQDCFIASKKFNSDNGSTHMADDSDSVKKRKGNEYSETQNYNTSLPSAGNHLQDSRGFMEVSSENDRRKEKKARVSRSAGKETCTSKGSDGADRKGRSTKDQQVGPHLGRTLSQRSLDAVDSLKIDLGSVQPSLAATSSSSKVSGTHKNKANFQEVKGSPVESVSSSPLRISKPEKFTSTRGKEDTHDAVFFSTRRLDGEDDVGIDRSEMVKKDETFTVTHRGSLESSALDLKDRDLGHLSVSKVKADSVPSPEFATRHVTDGHANTLGEEKVNSNQYHANGSRPRKSGKVSSSRSKDKSRNIRPELDKDNRKLSSFNESIAHTPHEEKLKAGKDKLHEKFAICCDEVDRNLASEKDSSGKVISGSGKRDSQSKSGRLNGSDAVSSKDPKQNLLLDRDGEKSSKRFPSEKTDQVDVSGRGKSYSLPPSGRAQNETLRCPQPIHRSQKENGANILSVGASEGGDVLKAPKQIKKAENQNGDQPSNLEHPTPKRPKVRDLDAASPIRRDSSSQAATNAIKEAKDLKHLADRLKNSGSNSESTGYYFQAALKFLHGASLLESSNSESSKHGETIQSIQVYSSTAKLCEFCAHEYEKSRDMASAALAYKCMEVAYLRVIYSSHSSANRDRHELQTALHSVPLGESPSSSASDIDNLNNPASLDKVAVPKGVSSPQVAGNHVIAARNRSNFVRMLNFAQEVNFAMEASRKARISFAATNAKLEESKYKDSTSSVKRALDFNFQDVEGLLRRVRLAMEVISR